MVGLGLFSVPFNCKCPIYSNGRYTFSPYWTCSHNCIFCYAKRGYRWNYWAKRSKSPIAVDLPKVLNDYLGLEPRSEIECSSSCDSFDLVFEKKYEITKKFLETIVPKREDIFFTFVTKSNLIDTYLNLFPKTQTVVQITVESYGEKIKKSSPKASSYIERKKSVSLLLDSGIQTAIRIDPIIPNFDTTKDIINIIDDFVKIGIEHITCSCIKLYKGQIHEIESALSINLRKSMYLKTEKELFIKDTIRRGFFETIKNKCEDYGITFATCRENLLKDTGLCDPFHLLSNYKKNEKEKNIPKFKELTDFF